MPELSKERSEQIRQMHAPFIHAMVKACQNEEEKRQFQPQIQTLLEQGWEALAKASQRLLNGERNASLLMGLDEDDQAIVGGILEGIQNPATLPDLNAEAKASDAAPGLASIIHAAGSGDTGALHALSIMSEQMSQTGGSMAELASIMRRLVNGERDLDQLAEKLSPKSESLLIGIINHLGTLERH